MRVNWGLLIAGVALVILGLLVMDPGLAFQLTNR